MIGTIIKKIRTGFYTNLCKKAAKQYGKKLHVNHWSRFTSKTHIGDNCHFNGMKVTGNGNVTIGNNFHSGGGVTTDGICSLNPKEDRLAFSCLCELDKQGNITEYKFAKTVIRSRSTRQKS